MASELIESKLKNLPDLPGCYIMPNANDDIIYIGKAKNLKNRVLKQKSWLVRFIILSTS